MFFEERFKLLRLQTLKTLCLSLLSKGFQESREQAFVSVDGQLGDFVLRSSVPEIAVHEPMVRFSNALGALQRADFSVGQISKQMFEGGEHLEPGPKPRVSGWGKGDKGLEKWFRHGLGQLGAMTDAPFDEKGVELTAGAQELLAVSDGEAALLEII